MAGVPSRVSRWTGPRATSAAFVRWSTCRDLRRQEGSSLLTEESYSQKARSILRIAFPAKQESGSLPERSQTNFIGRLGSTPRELSKRRHGSTVNEVARGNQEPLRGARRPPNPGREEGSFYPASRESYFQKARSILRVAFPAKQETRSLPERSQTNSAGSLGSTSRELSERLQGSTVNAVFRRNQEPLRGARRLPSLARYEGSFYPGSRESYFLKARSIPQDARSRFEKAPPILGPAPPKPDPPAPAPATQGWWGTWRFSPGRRPCVGGSGAAPREGQEVAVRVRHGELPGAPPGVPKLLEDVRALALRLGVELVDVLDLEVGDHVSGLTAAAA
jgi:hypothetical protein